MHNIEDVFRMTAGARKVLRKNHSADVPAVHRQSDGGMAGSCKNAAQRSLQLPHTGERVRMQCMTSRTFFLSTLRAPAHCTKKTGSNDELPVNSHMMQLDQNLPAVAASSTDTATDTVIPTIGLFPAPISPIIST